MDASPSVTQNSAARQFELMVEGQRCTIDYDIEGDKIYLAHAVVPPALRNRGLAAQLTEQTLQMVEAQGLKAVPLCSYIVAYIHRHPAWQRVVAPR